MSDKQDRKQLKQPDEFQVVAGKAMGWLVDQRTLVLGALGGVVVLAIVLWGVSAWSDSREGHAGSLLSEALELSARPIAGEGALQPGQESFPTKEAREKAFSDALEKVRSEVPSSTAARTAGAQLGFLKLKAGDAAAASTLLADYLAKAGKEDPLHVTALEALGAAQEKQGKFDDAKATYAKLAELGAPERAAWQQARLLLEQGKPEAKDALEKVAKDFAKDGVAMEAQRRLELAALPPPPPPGSTPAPAVPAPAPAPVKGKAPAKPAKPVNKKG